MMVRSCRVDRVTKRERLVAGAVIGLNNFEDDPERSEPGMGSLVEADRGDGFLVGEHFAVREPSVTVDRRVHERVTDFGGLRIDDVAAAMGSPTTTGWDPPQLLHIDLDLFAGTVVGDLTADHRPGRPVHPVEPIQTLAAQHLMHRRGGHVQDAGDTSRTEFAFPAQHLDASLELT